MTVTFAEKLSRMPHYEAGTSLDDAKARADDAADAVKLASNESPFPPHPDVVEAIATAAADVNRYPDPEARVLRRAIADHHETDPARIAVANGSCEILLAAAVALCEPGDEILYAWPSFSIYPHLPALSGAREIRVPLADGYVHDLDAMLEEVTAATQLLIVCNPNNPTGTHLPVERDRVLRARACPRTTTVILDEAYIEFQTNDDPDATLDLLAELPEPRRAAHLQQVPRPGRAARRLRALLAAVPRGGRRRAPAVQRQRARAGGRGGGDPPPGRRRAPRRDERRSSGSSSRRALRELGFATAESQANFSWIELGDRDEAEVVARPRRARESRSGRAPRSAAPATSGSPTARAPRTSASSPRSASWPERSFPCDGESRRLPSTSATKSAVITPARRSLRPRAATRLAPRAYFYFWRFT